MDSKVLFHILVLTISIALGFAFPQSTLAEYDLEIAAILFISFYLAKHLLLPKGQKFRLLESVIFTLIVLLTVNTTGGVDSPFFFLVYFLLFSLALLLEPVISLTTSLTLVVFYLFSLPQNPAFKQLLPIFSLAFITPFALYLGKEYLEIKMLKRQKAMEEENFLLFLSLVIKSHIKKIKEYLENFQSKDLPKIKKQIKELEKLIDRYEKSF